jgi:hypothetical protein
MNLPGETEAGTAGMQPCRGITGRAHRAAILSRCALASKKPSDDRPSCLENPRPAGAEYSLTENVASPFQAEPRQINVHSNFYASAACFFNCSICCR